MHAVNAEHSQAEMYLKGFQVAVGQPTETAHHMTSRSQNEETYPLCVILWQISI